MHSNPGRAQIKTDGNEYSMPDPILVWSTIRWEWIEPSNLAQRVPIPMHMFLSYSFTDSSRSALTGFFLVEGFDVRELMFMTRAGTAHDAHEAIDEEHGDEADREQEIDPSTEGHERDEG